MRRKENLIKKGEEKGGFCFFFFLIEWESTIGLRIFMVWVPCPLFLLCILEHFMERTRVLVCSIFVIGCVSLIFVVVGSLRFHV